MKAPICIICGNWVSIGEKTGKYIYFKVAEKEQIAHNNQLREGMVGHPYGVEMFCIEHYQMAKKFRRKGFRRLTWEQARPLIERVVEFRKKINDN